MYSSNIYIYNIDILLFMVFSFDLESFGWKQGPYWLQPCSLRWLHRQNGRGNEVWDYAGAAVAVPGFWYKMMVLVVKW